MIGTPIVKGRSISEEDTAAAQHVAVIAAVLLLPEPGQGAFLIPEFAIDTVILLLVVLSIQLVARNQLHPGYEAIGVGNHDMARWVVGRAAPVHATHIARKRQRSLKTWRREHALPA